MNQGLKGYNADIRKLSFHPIGLSLTLYDLKFLQEGHPDRRSSMRHGWMRASSGRRSSVADWSPTSP
jgi:hypothetical protein